MGRKKVFISHATCDDDFVSALREKLETYGIPVWVDSRKLRGGDLLKPEIKQAIEEARHVFVVLSPQTQNSMWVRKETRLAAKVAQAKKGYRVIPILLPGVETGALGLWFEEEPVAVPVALDPGDLQEALPRLLAALGERLPTDSPPVEPTLAAPIEDLVLKLSDPGIEIKEGKQILSAMAVLEYHPADPAKRPVTSKRYSFTAPLGPIERDDLRWYLEDYYIWPVGVFAERAQGIEEQIPAWGSQLFQAALGTSPSTRKALEAWSQAPPETERRFSVEVDQDPPEGAPEEKSKATQEAASALLALPWELLRNDQGPLFYGKTPALVRRRLPNRRDRDSLQVKPPVRVLLVSPRPEEVGVSYIDHRVSAQALVTAMEELGDLVELTVLTPPTFQAMAQALRENQYDVVHFDGHGVYDKQNGLGALCFEDPEDTGKLQDRRSELIHANRLSEIMQESRIPLVFLEACQTAQQETDPSSSVATALLQQGVTSVAAMSHSVLVETARRFITAFYHELAHGARVGSAMRAGQLALYENDRRGPAMGGGELRLQDWFVPVLFQEEQDPQMFLRLPGKEADKLRKRAEQSRFGSLPEPPAHAFVGRSRELLALERLCFEKNWAVVCGQGGAGKTALTVEFARWMLRSRRFARSAFVSMENRVDVRSVLDQIGQQVLPGEDYSVAQHPNLSEALQPVERALGDHATLIVLDNLESVLPDPSGQTDATYPMDELLKLVQTLLDADPATRLIFTSREPLPAPFDGKNFGRHYIGLGALAKKEAIKLVENVMQQQGWTPATADPGQTDQEVTDLVEAVRCHARALVLLAPEVAQRGVRATTSDLQQLLVELDQLNPEQNRENSLFASVELSLRRISPATREKIKALAVCHGGVHLFILGHLTETKTDEAGDIAIELINVGLGQDMGYGYLRLDPALAPYLQMEQNQETPDSLTESWVQGMIQLVDYLYQQKFKDAQMAASLTLLELPNLIALLNWLAASAAPESASATAGRIEQLVANLSRPRALERAVQVRQGAAEKIGPWSRVRFENERLSVERFLQQGDLQQALQKAQALLNQALESGEEAYSGAAYDIAVGHVLLGRVPSTGGAAEAALEPLAQALQRFEALAEQGGKIAACMASICLGEQADCLTDLGRLDEAAAAYEESIKRHVQLGNERDVAVRKGQLGTVRILQRRFQEALEAWNEAREIFEDLGETRSVATAWHQIGLVHEEDGQYESAEKAYRQSLAIEVSEGNLAGQADSLGQLGNLYDGMGRIEESVSFSRQCADIYAQLGDLKTEGMSRSNLAVHLIKLERYDSARQELLRAIDCKKPFGHASEPWKTWNILNNLESACANPSAAAEAKSKAVNAFLAYRRDGGENLSGSATAKLCSMVQQSIANGQTEQALQQLQQLAGRSDLPNYLSILIPKLKAILQGERKPDLANDPQLDYDDAAELLLLLEGL